MSLGWSRNFIAHTMSCKTQEVRFPIGFPGHLVLQQCSSGASISPCTGVPKPTSVSSLHLSQHPTLELSMFEIQLSACEVVRQATCLHSTFTFYPLPSFSYSSPRIFMFVDCRFLLCRMLPLAFSHSILQCLQCENLTKLTRGNYRIY